VHLVSRYLAAFGPATKADVASYTGLKQAVLKPALAAIEPRELRGETGDVLLDLPGAPLPGGDAEAPVRFLPTWDATLLVHARRTGVLPEEHRPRIFNTKMPQSVPTFLVDGEVAGTWRHTDSRITLEPFAPLEPAAGRALRDEAERLAAFHT
jgi:hypothetical protein